MRALNVWFTRGLVIGVAGLAAISCAPTSRQDPRSDPATAATTGTHPVDQPIPLILAADEGERRVRRVLGGAPLTIKVDPITARSPEFVMGYESIPPGEAISPHRHPSADEIIFIHRGSGVVELGDRTAQVTDGATVYIPRSTRIALRNTGTEPLTIVFIFSKPGFETFLRSTSVPAGEPVTPLSSDELRAIRLRHVDHAVYERP
jgi:mannose-6-phosphate isomerase-like protein (cupin superfamily)